MASPMFSKLFSACAVYSTVFFSVQEGMKSYQHAATEVSEDTVYKQNVLKQTLRGCVNGAFKGAYIIVILPVHIPHETLNFFGCNIEAFE